MKNNKKQVIFSICLIIAMAVGITGVNKRSQAATGNTYVAKATPYYKHPVTGKIEDPGNNEGIGQSMTESVLYKKALIEELSDGTLYATVRIFLTDNISGIKIWTQKAGGGDWKAVSTKIMQENMNGKYCSDYRFQIPEKKAIMRMSFYVTPMGRDVIFYFNFSNLKKGSSDFVVSIKKESEAKTSNANTKSSSAKKHNPEKEREQTSTETASTKTKSTETISTGKRETTSASATPESKTTNSMAQTESQMTGEELVENADGLTLPEGSDALETSSQETEDKTQSDATDSSKTAGGDKDDSNAKNGTQEPLRISWILVLQCILIISVPSILILITYGVMTDYMRRHSAD